MNALEVLKFEKLLRARNNGSLMWTTRDGRQVPVKDMTDEHLNNSITMLERAQEHQEMLMEALSSAPNYLFY